MSKTSFRMRILARRRILLQCVTFCRVLCLALKSFFFLAEFEYGCNESTRGKNHQFLKSAVNLVCIEFVRIQPLHKLKQLAGRDALRTKICISLEIWGPWLAGDASTLGGEVEMQVAVMRCKDRMDARNMSEGCIWVLLIN